MLINKKLAVTLCLVSAIGTAAVASLPPDEGAKNLKVLPKKISHEQLDHIMDDWSHALGVHCNFCHARDEQGKRLDFASDAKPEKNMAREMFKMTGAINKKYFKAEKDSLGMVMFSGVNCVTCHHGSPHPEVKGGDMPHMGPGMPPPPGQNGQQGTPPPPPPAPGN